MWNEIDCTKLQLPPEPPTRGLPSPDPRSLCPLSSTEFVDPPPETKFMGTPLPIPLSEKLIPIQQTARRHFPGDRDLIAHRRENLKLNVDVILEKVRNVHW